MATGYQVLLNLQVAVIVFQLILVVRSFDGRDCGQVTTAFTIQNYQKTSIIQHERRLASTLSPSRTTYHSSSSSRLSSARETYFQLEEREDADVSVTEIFCREDGTVQVFGTDGPPTVSASGFWDQELVDVQYGQARTKGTFTMKLRRKYHTGREKTLSTDVGDFDYEVVRCFKGDFGPVGDRLGVSGKIFQSPTDMSNDENEIGFFELIDTTEDRFRHLHAFSPEQKIRIDPLPVDSKLS